MKIPRGKIMQLECFVFYHIKEGGIYMNNEFYYGHSEIKNVQLREQKKKAFTKIVELTNGELLYTNQIFDVLSSIGGFSPAQACLIRKDILKSNLNSIQVYTRLFEQELKGAFTNKEIHDFWEFLLKNTNKPMNFYENHQFRLPSNKCDEKCPMCIKEKLSKSKTISTVWGDIEVKDDPKPESKLGVGIQSFQSINWNLNIKPSDISIINEINQNIANTLNPTLDPNTNELIEFWQN